MFEELRQFYRQAARMFGEDPQTPLLILGITTLMVIASVLYMKIGGIVLGIILMAILATIVERVL